MEQVFICVGKIKVFGLVLKILWGEEVRNIGFLRAISDDGAAIWFGGLLVCVERLESKWMYIINIWVLI